MRIALRTGGGRGAYELAGSQGDYRASDLFDKLMFYELTPSLVIPGYAIPSLRSGKPRIQLLKERADGATHLCYVLANVLLLPEPRRAPSDALGETLIAYKTYSMTVIKIDISRLEERKSIVRPTEIVLENSKGDKQKINCINRMARVMELWRVADKNDSSLSTLLKNHRNSIYNSNLNHKDIQKAAKALFIHLNTIHDPLSQIEDEMGVEKSVESEDPVFADETKLFGINDAISPIVARLENIKRWKKVAVRGSTAVQFSNFVKEVYRDTCLFTGQRLPKLEAISSAGVDAAHILPWASHGINTVDNGICLSKQCHWAFDAGVVKFSFDPSVNQYLISIPREVCLEAKRCNFSLEVYQAIEGPVPRERLPSNTSFWPNPSYLASLNEIMFTQK